MEFCTPEAILDTKGMPPAPEKNRVGQAEVVHESRIVQIVLYHG